MGGNSNLGFGVWGFGFRVWGLGFRVQGLRLRESGAPRWPLRGTLRVLRCPRSLYYEGSLRRQFVRIVARNPQALYPKTLKPKTPKTPKP